MGLSALHDPGDEVPYPKSNKEDGIDGDVWGDFTRTHYRSCRIADGEILYNHVLRPIVPVECERMTRAPGHIRCEPIPKYLSYTRGKVTSGFEPDDIEKRYLVSTTDVHHGFFCGAR